MLSSFGSRDEQREQTGGEQQRQFVVFRVHEKEFGVDIHQAREIISATDLTYIPNAPDYVLGIINLRGEIVPVIDLDKRLELSEEGDQEEEDKIIIVEIDDSLIGMYVSDVTEIIRLSTQNIGSAPEITQEINRDFVAGVGKLDDRLLILLNLNRVLSKKEVKELDELEMKE